jgi:glycosyltransferase 2 family protein
MKDSFVGRRAQVLTLIAVAVVVVLLARHLDFRAMGAALATMSWRWAAAAAISNLIGIVVEATRWRFVMPPSSRASLLSTLRALLVGLVGNIVLPLKAGEGVRAVTVAKLGNVPMATAVTSVLLDRVFDFAAFPVFVALASLIVTLPAPVLRFRFWAIVVLAIAAPVCAIIASYLHRRHRRSGVERHPDTLTRIIEGLSVFGERRRLLPAAGAALVAWLMRTMVIWCMLRAFDLSLPTAAAVTTLVVVNLSIAAVAAPGNIGVFELSAAGALALWGVVAENGVSFGLGVHAAEVVPTAVLGVIAVMTMPVSFPVRSDEQAAH